MTRYSIIHDLSEKKCIICGSTENTHIHEVFFGMANRQQSIKYGLCVCLCAKHHNMSDEGVHFNKEMDNALKSYVQAVAQKHYSWNTSDFIKIFGKNYID